MSTTAISSPSAVLAEIAAISAEDTQAQTLIKNAQTSLMWAEQMRPREAEQEVLEQLQAIASFAGHGVAECHEIGQKALVCMEAQTA